jgi:L-glutamine-phosphate cytidylyltransferase
MLAIILNSGKGTRLGDLTNRRPKCLLPLPNDETILSRQIRILSSLGFDDFIVTTGPFAEMVQEEVGREFPELRVKYIFNNKYNYTNYIYSMSLIDSSAKQDCLLLHGDLVFEKGVIDKMMNVGLSNYVVVYTNQELPEKDFKARIKDGQVSRVGVGEFGVDCVSLQPLYGMTKEFWSAWMEMIEVHVSEGRTREYAEEALNDILNHHILTPLAMDGELCMEIDDAMDYDKAWIALNGMR